MLVKIVCFKLASTIQVMPSPSSSMMRSCPASLCLLRHFISPGGGYIAFVSRASGISAHRVGQHKRQPDSHRGNSALKARGDNEQGELLIEEELRSKRRKRKSKVDVIAPQVEQAYGLEPQTAQGQLETSYLLFLALVFAIIILEGLFIATSGFLPEAADRFAQDVVYPSFSPTVGFFLLLSTAYGIWKSRQ